MRPDGVTTALQRRQDAQLALPGIVSRTGMELRPGLSKAEWLEAGRLCALVERANRWWIGDLLKYGEHTYGDAAFGEVHELFELDYATLNKFRWVASSIDILRRTSLSWSHHEVVAAFDPETQDYWLKRAETSEPKWSVRELKAWIKAEKAKPLPTHTPLLRFCQDLPTPIIVAQILRVYFPNASTAFDLTGGDGGFWDGSELLEVTRLIVDPDKSPSGTAEDFRDLSHLADDAFDVTLFDAPHNADAGEESVMGERYGTYAGAGLEDAIQRGAKEAWRIGRLGAVVKVTDQIHGQQYVLESDWVRAAIGQKPFDEVYAVRPNPMIDPKWGEQLSAYNNGSTYLIFRKDGPKHVRRNGR